MSEPLFYSSSIVLNGTIGHYAGRLDPQNWEHNAPEIWRGSFLIGAALIPGGLPRFRSQVPPRAGPLEYWNGPGFFYEDVWVVGLHYRNVLQTSRTFARDSLGRDCLTFRYKQHDCLNTASNGDLLEGGIDVDYGGSVCTQIADDQVSVDISKNVRYTQPSYIEDELNALSRILTPLTFDSWLHQLVWDG